MAPKRRITRQTKNPEEDYESLDEIDSSSASALDSDSDSSSSSLGERHKDNPKNKRNVLTDDEEVGREVDPENVGTDDGSMDEDDEMAREELEREMMKKKLKTIKSTDSKTSVRRNIRMGAKAKADAVLSKLREKREKMDLKTSAKKAKSRRSPSPPPPPPPSGRPKTESSSRHLTSESNHRFQPGSIELIQSICLKRTDLEKWIHNPHLNEWIIGCALRMCIGEAKNGEPMYRLVEIVDIVDGETIYSLEKTATTKSLKVKHGRSENVFKASFASNSPITEAEYHHWLDTVEKANLPQFSESHCYRMIHVLDKARMYEMTAEDLDRVRESKMKVNKGPVNVASRLTDLGNKLRIAQSKGDFDQAERLENEIVMLENMAAKRNKLSGEKMFRASSGAMTFESQMSQADTMNEPSESLELKFNNHVQVPAFLERRRQALGLSAEVDELTDPLLDMASLYDFEIDTLDISGYLEKRQPISMP